MRLRIITIFYGLLVPLSLFGQGVENKTETKKTNNIKTTEQKNTVSETNNFGLSNIGQIAVSVNDLERATAFYRDKLGMKYLFTANGMAFLEANGIIHRDLGILNFI